MKKLSIVLVSLFLVSSAFAQWTTFVIRENSTEGAPAIVARNDIQTGAIEFGTFAASQKAALATDDVSGSTIGDLDNIGITRLDDLSRFTTGSGPYVAPYFNIWVTDGTGKYAVLANEPSDPGVFTNFYNNGQWSFNQAALASIHVKVFETNFSDLDWLYSGAARNSAGYLTDGTNNLTFGDLGSVLIEAPDIAYIAANYPAGSGAPRELGTNLAYAFNWVFGDTAANYISGYDPDENEDGFIVANPTIIPEPATLTFFALGSLTLLCRKNK